MATVSSPRGHEDTEIWEWGNLETGETWRRGRCVGQRELEFPFSASFMAFLGWQLDCTPVLRRGSTPATPTARRLVGPHALEFPFSHFQAPSRVPRFEETTRASRHGRHNDRTGRRRHGVGGAQSLILTVYPRRPSCGTAMEMSRSRKGPLLRVAEIGRKWQVSAERRDL